MQLRNIKHKKYSCPVLIFFTSVLFCITQKNYAQSSGWTGTKNWKLYDLAGKKPLTIPADSLYAYKNINLDDDSLRYFLKNAIPWPAEKTSVWMGGYTMSYTDRDQKIKKIDVSNYAGFFYDEKEKRYYEIANDLKQEWKLYLDRAAEQLIPN
jgi:hypothetical protein